MRTLKTCYGHVGVIKRNKNTLWIKEYVSPDFSIFDCGYATFRIFNISWRRYRKRLQYESNQLQID